LSTAHVRDSGAKERLESKLADLADRHCVARERGEEPTLEGASVASLVGLILSYPHHSVPPEVGRAARSKVEATSPGSHSAAAKLLSLSLASKGYERGLQ
jgi:hypothetical protein